MNTTIAIVLVVAIVGCCLILAIAWLIHAYVATKPVPVTREVEEAYPPMQRVFVDRGRVLPKPSSVRSAWFRSRWLKSNSSLNKNHFSFPSSTPESPGGTKHFSIYVKEKLGDEELGQPGSPDAKSVSSVYSSETTRKGRRIHRTPTFDSIKAVARNHARASRPGRLTSPRHKSLPSNFTNDSILERPPPVQLSPLQSRYAVLQPTEPYRLAERLENIRRAHLQQTVESPEFPDPLRANPPSRQESSRTLESRSSRHGHRHRSRVIRDL